MTFDQGKRLMQLHTDVVKAAQRWEAATSGTQKKRELERRWASAEDKFTHFVMSITQPITSAAVNI